MAEISYFLNMYNYLENPWYLTLIIPAVILIIYLMNKDFIKLKEEDDVRARRLLVRKIMLISRIIICALLIIALATPYAVKEQKVEGDPILKIIVDKSNSMQVLETISADFIDQLRKKVEVEVMEMGSPTQSDIGDTILGHLGPFESILLISDGHVTKGANIGDVALYATKIQSTINALELDTKKQDASIWIEGPQKVMSEVENTFTIKISKTKNMGSVPVQIIVDDASVYDQSTDRESIEITKSFTSGYHKIIAQIKSSDHFQENNIYYKTIKVVQKPRILYVSKKTTTPILSLLRQVFDVTIVSQLPPNDYDAKQYLKDFYALIINDVHANDIDNKATIIDEFLTEGNGMLVVGGQSSYNNGRYRNSLFESTLPVNVGRPGKKEGDMNIVIVIDISGSTGSAFGKGTTVDVEKALALSVLQNLKKNNKVAFVAFNTKAFRLTPLVYLFEHKKPEEIVGRLIDGGGTWIHAGIMEAINILKYSQGSKNIILISDGITQAQSSAFQSAKEAANEGIKIYTVGVGEKTNEQTMNTLAEITSGIYFKATDATRLKILFGDIDKSKPGDYLGLAVLNSNHFITQGLDDLKASVSGFNEVVPKTTGQLLVTTSSGEPILTVWRRGLGRVAALATDDGENWAGDLLNKQNSRLLTRTGNWIIGEPDRKAKETTDVQDTRIGEPTTMIIKSSQQPKSEQHTFYKIDENAYTTTITPTTTGFQEAMGITFASNYPLEYQYIGMNPQIKSVAEVTGGKIFNKNQIDEIVEYTKTKSKRTIVQNQPARMPFIILATLIFLVEIFIRRWLRKE